MHYFPIVSPRFSTGSSSPGRPGSGLERAERADSRQRGVQWSLVLFTKFGDAMVNKQKAIENGHRNSGCTVPIKNGDIHGIYTGWWFGT